MKRKWGERLRWQLMASLPWRHLKVLSSTVFSSCQLMGSFPIYEHVVPQSLCLNKLKFHIIQNPFSVLNLPKTINAKICNVVQSLKSYPTLCDSMFYSMPGFPVLYYLAEFSQTHVHWVSDAIQPPHPVWPLLLLLSVFTSIRVLSSELALGIR